MDTGFTREEDLNFWKNLLLVGLFFLMTPITLTICLFSLYSLSASSNLKPVIANAAATSNFSGVQVYASLPAQIPSVSGEVGASDARGEIVKNYLKRYNSPMESHAYKLVQASDKYGLDYRLLPAIAQQESNLCKIIPPGTHNCWGWGIHSQGTLGFDSYDESIEAVAKGLKTQYVDKGLKTVREIMSKYNPNSPDAAWARGVQQFIDEME